MSAPGGPSRSVQPRPDHLIIGAGHNGLSCALELARRGRRVLVVEAAAQAGGAAVTREFAAGFQVSAGAHLLYGMPPAALRSLGVTLAGRMLPTSSLAAAGAPVVFSGGGVSGAGGADAAAYARFTARMACFARIVCSLQDTTPFSLDFARWRDRIDALKLAFRVRALGRRDMQELLRIAAMNAYDLLADSFECDALKGALGFDATLGAEHGARAPGTVLTLLHRLAALERGGGLGLAQPAGGMGTVTQAMLRAATAAGVRIRTGARVRRILVKDDRACGVQLETGEAIDAASVISNADPKATFLRLLDPCWLDTDFVRRVDRYRCLGKVAKVHLALDGMPRFAGLEPALLGGRLVVSPSLDALELAFNPSKYGELPQQPVLEVTIPTVNDPSLAPAGRHVMSINVMFVPYEAGSSAGDAAAARAQLQSRVMAVLEQHSAGLGSRVLACETLLPADLEREFGMTGGHWHHGALAFDQFFFTRPVPGAARYDTPLPGLFLCGAGSHPGGGVTGLAGRNAARRILQAGA